MQDDDFVYPTAPASVRICTRQGARERAEQALALASTAEARGLPPALVDRQLAVAIAYDTAAAS